MPANARRFGGHPPRRSSREPGDWVAVKALAVLAGNSARAAAEIAAEAEAAGLTAAQRTGAGACTRYLTTKHEYWRQHLAREHQRLCHGTAQGQCTPGA